MSKRRVGIAFSSGGARGSAHIGVLKVLEENGIVPDVIVGTSMGAEIGGAYAAGVSLDEMESHWRSSSFGRVFKTLFPTIPWSGWSSGRELVRFLRQLLNDRNIEDLPIPFAAVATDLEAGSCYPITSGSLAEAIRASLSVPGLFTPVWIDNRLLIDGGVSNPMPVDIARDLGADVVIAVDVLVKPAEVRLSGLPAVSLRERSLGIVKGWDASEMNGRKFHPNVFSVLFQMSTVFQKRLCDLLLEASPPDVLIRPDFSADPPSYSNVGCGIEAGEDAARLALPAIRRAVSENAG
ncbi:MAG: patatin-like phospholipase family protein [Candidatus Bipolaricaulia bacterium]